MSFKDGRTDKCGAIIVSTRSSLPFWFSSRVGTCPGGPTRTVPTKARSTRTCSAGRLQLLTGRPWRGSCNPNLDMRRYLSASAHGRSAVPLSKLQAQKSAAADNGYGLPHGTGGQPAPLRVSRVCLAASYHQGAARHARVSCDVRVQELQLIFKPIPPVDPDHPTWKYRTACHPSSRIFAIA